MIQRVLYAVIVWSTVTVASLGLTGPPAKANPTGQWVVTSQVHQGRLWWRTKVSPAGRWIVRGETIQVHPLPGPGEKVRATGQWTVGGLTIPDGGDDE